MTLVVDHAVGPVGVQTWSPFLDTLYRWEIRRSFFGFISTSLDIGLYIESGSNTIRYSLVCLYRGFETGEEYQGLACLVGLDRTTWRLHNTLKSTLEKHKTKLSIAK